jgi:hypothetical protein
MTNLWVVPDYGGNVVVRRELVEISAPLQTYLPLTIYFKEHKQILIIDIYSQDRDIPYYSGALKLIIITTFGNWTIC